MLPAVCSWNVARARGEATSELLEYLGRSIAIPDTVLLLQESDLLRARDCATRTFYKGSAAGVAIAVPARIIQGFCCLPLKSLLGSGGSAWLRDSAKTDEDLSVALRDSSQVPITPEVPSRVVVLLMGGL